MRRRLADIEKRVRDLPHVLYIGGASSKFTPEMDAYYARMRRRLEDCGTRNFPQRNGARVYGKGAIAMSLDSAGAVTETEIIETSGDPLVDSQMVRVVRAASPFGEVPARPTPDTTRPYTKFVVYTAFDFEHSERPSEKLAESERCKWR
jgi:protein TonB